MSSSDHGRRGRGRRIGRSIIMAFAAGMALSACTVQPLYGPTPAGQAVTAALSQIVIDPVDTRVAQEVRNKLIFDLTGGAPVSGAVYRMRLVVSTSESALGVTPVESAPAYSITVTVTYEVTALATGDIVLRATSRGTASYDRVTQVFANVRAKRDAENRAAALAADEIRVRLAAAAARGIL